MTKKNKIGYMCYTDFNEDLGNDTRGTKVYPTIEDIIHHKTCAKDCGVVEVQIKFKRVVVEPLQLVSK